MSEDCMLVVVRSVSVVRKCLEEPFHLLRCYVTVSVDRVVLILEVIDELFVLYSTILMILFY